MVVLIFRLILFGSTQNLIAQKVNEGKLNFAITYFNLPPEVRSREHMLPHDASFYFKGKKTRMEMGMAGMGKNITIYDGETGITYILLNVFGKKYAMKKTAADIQALKNAMSPDSLGIKLKVELKDDKKKIAGYECKRAVIIKTSKTDTTINECWYTQDIPPYNTAQDSALSAIPGFMMQSANQDFNGVTMQLLVTMVAPVPVDNSMFEIPLGYVVVTEEELNRIMPLLREEQQRKQLGY